MLKAAVLAGTSALLLTACGGSKPAETPGASSSQAAPTPAAGEAAPMPSTSALAVPSAETAAPPLSSADAKGEKGARAMAQTWARALEAGQFGAAWDQFGSPPATRAAYVKWWSRYRTIRVDLGTGDMEGAAGSLYYTVPATLTGTTTAGKPYRLQGDVVLRRVNDVDGATPEQLRWHLATADLKDVAVP